MTIPSDWPCWPLSALPPSRRTLSRWACSVLPRWLVLLREGVESFRAAALSVIAEKGYEAAVRAWTEGLDLNPFLSRRAADFHGGRRRI